MTPGHLRAATDKQNGENRAGAQRRSKTGVRGVYWDQQRGNWYVQAVHHGKVHTGGRFTDISEAENAAIALRNKLYTHNDRDREKAS